MSWKYRDDEASVLHGSGTPEAAVKAPPGTLYLDRTTAGYPVYRKISGHGNTGWDSALPTGGVPRRCGTWQSIAATSGTDTACSDGTAYVGLVYVPMACTVTGIQYVVGSVGGTDKVIASLHDLAGAVLANSAVAGATVGTAAQVQQVAFTATYAITAPHYYWLGVTFNGTTAKFRTVPAH